MLPTIQEDNTTTATSDSRSGSPAYEEGPATEAVIEVYMVNFEIRESILDDFIKEFKYCPCPCEWPAKSGDTWYEHITFVKRSDDNQYSFHVRILRATCQILEDLLAGPKKILETGIEDFETDYNFSAEVTYEQLMEETERLDGLAVRLVDKIEPEPLKSHPELFE